MNSQLTYREKFTSEIVFGNVPCHKCYEKEVWKDVKGYEGFYQVSNYGKIKSLPRKKIYLTRNNMVAVSKQSYIGHKQKNGYMVVLLVDAKGVKKYYKIHRIVAEAFVDNAMNKPFVNHINGIKDDNYAPNLEWCTQKENVQHAHQTGLYVPKTGAANHTSKLTKEDVHNIDNLINKGISSKVVANKYCITKESVMNAYQRRTYKEISKL